MPIRYVNVTVSFSWYRILLNSKPNYDIKQTFITNNFCLTLHDIFCFFMAVKEENHNFPQQSQKTLKTD